VDKELLRWDSRSFETQNLESVGGVLPSHEIGSDFGIPGFGISEVSRTKSRET